MNIIKKIIMWYKKIKYYDELEQENNNRGEIID